MFSHVIEEVCGVCYGPADVAILTSKLETRMLELGYESLQDYYARLRHDDLEGIELHALVETVLVHETYFFRELAPLAQLVNSHLAGVVRARGAARVWSAACSTGEEAFTLAMLLDDGGLLDRTSIVASDVSASAIAVAKTGHHGARALRDGHPPGLVRRYLRTRPNGGLAVVPRIRDAVQFQTLNLLDEDAVQGLGLFDAIVCRNVLIYFRDDRIAGVVDRLGRSLRPTGMIVVGVSESLLRFGTGLVCEERGSSFFYRSAR